MYLQLVKCYEVQQPEHKDFCQSDDLLDEWAITVTENEQTENEANQNNYFF